MGSYDQFTVADADGNGSADIVLLGADDLRLFFTDEDGALPASPSLVLPGGVSEQGVAAADFDGDGLVDLAFSANAESPGQQVVHLLRGLGAGAFAEPVVLDLVEHRLSVLVADLDGDGRPELLANGFAGTDRPSLSAYSVVCE